MAHTIQPYFILSTETLYRPIQPGLTPWRMIETSPLSGILDGFGDRLRLARKALGYRQNEFAALLGIGTVRYNNWETGKHPPAPEYMVMMKRRFGIGADWILAGDYLSLDARIVQKITQAGAAATAPEPARELRDEMRAAAVASAFGLHEDQAGPPRRTIRRGKIQPD